MKIEKIKLNHNAYYPNREVWKVFEIIDEEEWGLLCLNEYDIILAKKAIRNTINLTSEERKKL